MQVHKTTLERAFELARTGHYATVCGLKQRLAKEGYVADQLTGPTLLAQVRAILRMSQGDCAQDRAADRSR
jgi:hypothetical protein